MDLPHHRHGQCLLPLRARPHFGPFFIRFSSYFPFTGRVCINGHEWLKRQLDKRGIDYEALDNGIASCSDPAAVQRIADSLSARKIEVFVRRWLRNLPHPFTRADRLAGYHYDISMLQSEFSLTQMLDRPLTGRDFAIGKRLFNLPQLRGVGFSANRRLLSVHRISHDCAVGEDAFASVNNPKVVQDQRVSALRFADPRVHALFAVLVSFRLLASGFSNRDMRELLAPLLGIDPSLMTQGRMTYDLRRLRLHGLIERIEGTHRYRVTDFGLKTALFFTRAYARPLRPGLSHIMTPSRSRSPTLSSFDTLGAAMARCVETTKLVA